MATTVSKKLADFIIRKEVSSEEFYRKKYERPIWPGLESGLTVAIGYDLGYKTPKELVEDWTGYVSDSTIAKMKKYLGFRGTNAAAYLRASQDIRIPWEAAYKQFEEKTLPKWTKTVIEKLPNTDDLNEDQLGVLVSLAYNRGPNGFTMNGDKFKEMRAIKEHMQKKEFTKIPAELRSMKRLWNLNGLKIRRDEEADLFQKALANPPRLDKISCL